MGILNNKTFVLLASIPTDDHELSDTLDRRLGIEAIKDCVVFFGSRGARLIAVCDVPVLPLIRQTYQNLEFPEDRITFIPHNGNPQTDVEELIAIERARGTSVDGCLVVMGDEHTQTRLAVLRTSFQNLEVCPFSQTGGAAGVIPNIICKPDFIERARYDSPNFVFTLEHFFDRY